MSEFDDRTEEITQYEQHRENRKDKNKQNLMDM